MSYFDPGPGRYEYTDEEGIRKLLVGRTVQAVEDGDTSLLVLDDGTRLAVHGNEGCSVCPTGHFWVTALQGVPNMIMAVEFDHDDVTYTDHYYDGRPYQATLERMQIFVICDSNINRRRQLLEVCGHEDNGYYGDGYWIEVLHGSD